MGDIYMPDDSPSVRENNVFFFFFTLAAACIRQNKLRSSMYVKHNTEISHFTEADLEFIIDRHQRERVRKRKRNKEKEEERRIPQFPSLHSSKCIPAVLS